MIRTLPVLLSVALTVYCLIDAIQTDESEVRNLPKMAWLLLVLLFPVIGPISWLVAGRPEQGPGPVRSQQRRLEQHERERDAGRPRGPDDDPDFLKGL